MVYVHVESFHVIIYCVTPCLHRTQYNNRCAQCRHVVIVRCTSSWVKERAVGQQVDTVNAGGGEGEKGAKCQRCLGVNFTQKMHVPEHTYCSFHCLSEQWFSTRVPGPIKGPQETSMGLQRII